MKTGKNTSSGLLSTVFGIFTATVSIAGVSPLCCSDEDGGSAAAAVYITLYRWRLSSQYFGSVILGGGRILAEDVLTKNWEHTASSSLSDSGTDVGEV